MSDPSHLPRLTAKTADAECVDAEVALTLEQRLRSRQRVTLDDGRAAGIFLPRGEMLKDGDLLTSDDGLVVRVRAAAERLSTARCADPLLLARACYHLGNRHVPLQIEPGRLRWQHDHVLDAMVRGLGIEVVIEEAAFEPESGAYGAGGGHGHAH